MQAIWSRFSRPILAVWAVVSVMLSGVGLVWAAQDGTTSQNITMTPSSTELSVAPGGNTINSFNVVNEGDNPYGITISASPYHIEGINYDPQFTPLPGVVDASKWIHITDPTAQRLAAHKLTNVNYTLDVPTGTASGGYYAVLFAETNPITTSKTGLVSHDRVGNILYITVRGAVKTGGNLQAVNISHFSTASSLPIGMLVSNTGGVHFLASTSITVKSIFGQTTFHASTQRYVLPQTVRKISATWQNTPPIGLYRVERSSTVASINTQLSREWVLVVHPWVIIASAILALIIIGEIILKRRRTYKTSSK